MASMLVLSTRERETYNAKLSGMDDTALNEERNRLMRQKAQLDAPDSQISKATSPVGREDRRLTNGELELVEAERQRRAAK